jgi:hypothetical protein
MFCSRMPASQISRQIGQSSSPSLKVFIPRALFSLNKCDEAFRPLKALAIKPSSCDAAVKNIVTKFLQSNAFDEAKKNALEIPCQKGKDEVLLELCLELLKMKRFVCVEPLIQELSSKEIQERVLKAFFDAFIANGVISAGKNVLSKMPKGQEKDRALVFFFDKSLKHKDFEVIPLIISQMHSLEIKEESLRRFKNSQIFAL